MYEFDRGAVTGTGFAFVGDESTGFIALIDFSQNDNGTILDPGNMVCLTSFLSAGIDDIAPLTGLDAPTGGIFEDGFEGSPPPGKSLISTRIIRAISNDHLKPDLGDYRNR